MDPYGYDFKPPRSYAGSVRESMSEYRYPPDQQLTSGGSATFVETPDGWLFRPPENGHVITRGEMLARMVPYYEMFLTNVLLLGYNVLKDAAASTETNYRVVLFDACTDRWHIPGFDFCVASRLVWCLIGGAVVYFIFTGSVGLLLAIELKRKGFHSSFTALWHSPLFLLCFLFPAKMRVDVLSIPNKFVGLSIWTRTHLHKIALAVYAATCMVLIVLSLARGTAEEFVIQGTKSIQDNKFSRFYNAYLTPYYLALYIFTRVLVTTAIEVVQDKNVRNRPERVGRFYKSIKDD